MVAIIQYAFEEVVIAIGVIVKTCLSDSVFDRTAFTDSRLLNSFLLVFFPLSLLVRHVR